MKPLTRVLILVALLGTAIASEADLTPRVDAQAPGGALQTPGAPGTQAGGGARGGGGGGRGAAGPSAGQTLYNDQQCTSCHGAPGAIGTARSTFDMKWLDSTTDAKIGDNIKNHPRHTDKYKTMTDEQVWDLLRYIRMTTGAALADRTRPFNEKPDGVVVKSEKQTFKIELVTEGLMTPWALAFLPDGRMLITERDGRVQMFNQGKLTLVTGTPKAHVQQDGGMLDVEVHPRYAQNGWIYLAYSEVQPGYVAPPPAPDPAAAPAAGGRGGGRGGNNPPSLTVVVRGKLNARNEWTDEQVIYRMPTEYYTTAGAHYGTRLIFDQQNHLFFTIGDRTSTPNQAQDVTKPLGKVHRFNDDGTIPNDNPFVNTPNAVKSVWTYGHRNPEGLAWDPAGTLWESEHGQNSADEVNVLIKGHNYGWNLVAKQGPPTYKISEAGMDDPVVYYTPTFAPAGISFYTGNRYPGWSNTSLFVGGLAGQALRRIEVKGTTAVTQEVIFSDLGRVRDIVEAPDGYFYIALQNPTGIPNVGLPASTPGRVIRLVPQ